MPKHELLSSEHTSLLLKTLEKRFEANPNRHPEITWKHVEAMLEKQPEKLSILQKMEETGGEPDVVIFNEKELFFCDCSVESPKERRSFCYDREALEKRKEHKPKNSAMDAAKEIGIELLDETQYHQLQTLGTFDLKTSSWLKTPEAVRKLGGAIFGDRRYDRVFIYHNGADSYYAARGFRGILKL